MLVLTTKNVDYSGYEGIPNWVAVSDRQLIVSWLNRNPGIRAAIASGFTRTSQRIGPVFIKVLNKGNK